MTTKVDHTGCGWERYLRQPKTLDVLVNAILPTLDKRKNDFDGLVVCGYSMSLISPILAYWTDKAVCVVNKVGEHRNSNYSVEGLHSQRWLMVDDLVSSGVTIERCGNAVESIDGSLVGLITYNQYWDSPHTEYVSKAKEKEVQVPIWFSMRPYELMQAAGLEE